MVDAASGAGSAPSGDKAPAGTTRQASKATTDRKSFRAGAGRTICFSLVFLLLLPFFVSLGPMLYWRISQNQWTGTVGLIVLAIAFTAVMYLIFVELIFSIRSRVIFGETTVRLSLPQGRGLSTPFSYQVRDIPYDEIAAVEVRREVYGGSFAPVMMKGTRIRLKDGSTYKLGYVNEANADPCLPYAEIGEKIAARAGARIIDNGDVRRSAIRKFFGLLPAGTQINPITPDEIKVLNGRHSSLMTVLVGTMALLLGFGVASERHSDIGHANFLGSLWAPPSQGSTGSTAAPAPPAAKR